MLRNTIGLLHIVLGQSFFLCIFEPYIHLRIMPETDNIPAKQRFVFGKTEHLCLEKEIDRLFSSGERFLSFPLQVVYLPVENGGGAVSALFSVSKKRFKRAVHRNRVKRLMRECFRLNRASLCALLKEKKVSLSVAFVFIDKALPDYQLVEKGMLKAMGKLIERLQ